MKGSLERVRRVMAHQKPDHIPLFDLLPNDAVLRHFNNGRPVEVGDDRSGIRAIVAATDGSRHSYFSPMAARHETPLDGRKRIYERWTVWTAPRVFSSSREYEDVKRCELAERRRRMPERIVVNADPGYRKLYDWFGEDYYYLMSVPHVELMSIYSEVGLEAFSYYLADCESVIIEQIEINTEHACRWAAGIPADDPFHAVFIGDDIAFKSGPMVNPRWLEGHYFPCLRRVIRAFHARGKKVVFHSDGNLNAIMGSLVEAGIDALNPIEIMAGMDLKDLHKRYPKLVFAGGIDVSHLLPFGTPREIKDAVVKAIEDTEGQILVGSSTEVTNMVPLENFLAMREAAMECHW
ncbi:MAG: hypothetical protein KKG09_02065 [Verrucomicrobia bacterium]|nr:hypothetical protein [Verrucomicrobiota bacterium]MCG2681414.1 hypothetical protein [Kiritimatiellia bacterium]MBU4248314.1 hypothetical protein [Verrucomicrobiota bacterium]MBU4289841.1 hypothetical protein [Verrucomicrobiota bacterium]MBU4429500.1 hypothetical protein [Verrucomicrobiota bacterium]